MEWRGGSIKQSRWKIMDMTNSVSAVILVLTCQHSFALICAQILPLVLVNKPSMDAGMSMGMATDT